MESSAHCVCSHKLRKSNTHRPDWLILLSLIHGIDIFKQLLYTYIFNKMRTRNAVSWTDEISWVSGCQLDVIVSPQEEKFPASTWINNWNMNLRAVKSAHVCSLCDLWSMRSESQWRTFFIRIQWVSERSASQLTLVFLLHVVRLILLPFIIYHDEVMAMAIGKTSKKFPEVSQPQKPLETLENHGNLWRSMEF